MVFLMPLYDFKCAKCGRIEEHWAKMDEKMHMCDCGHESDRLITSRIYLQTDYASRDFVTADITGSEVRITSRKQLRNLCKENGVTPKEGGAANKTLDLRKDNQLQDRWV